MSTSRDLTAPYATTASAAQSASMTPSRPGPSARKPFDMADLAAAALARPRSLEPWAERDDLAECPPSPSSSSGSASPYASLPTSPWSDATSCAMTPSSSAGSFCLPPPLAPPPVAVPRSRISPSTSCPAIPAELPPLPQKREPTLPRAVSTPALPPSPPADPWQGVDFSLKLLFTPSATGGGRASPNGDESLESTLPPAFFPSQRISFSPRLRIASAAGLPFSSLGGMHLGVTGMCEILDEQGAVRSQRMIADFCIDLTSGLRVWRRDAEAAARQSRTATKDEDVRLPPGTYVLPLSMKVPNSDRLPPSYECAQFRITYTMSIALFSAATNSNGTPRRLKVFSVPFHVLPSTLPAPAPELPSLTHDHKKGVFESLMRSLSFSSPKLHETGFHTVIPSLPTSHYSPGASAAVPVSLRIVDRPLEPTDLYVRLAIVRKVYVRQSARVGLERAIEERWGLEEGVPISTLGYPEEMLVEPWCVEEEEIVSRWGWIPYSARPGANPEEENEIQLDDIMLPLCGADGRGWTHGYSSSLDLEPSAIPATTHGDCSWFSPAFRTRAPVASEYGQHVHVSSRFYLSVEIGFAPPTLGETLEQLHRQTPDLAIPRPFEFTTPSTPTTSVYSGLSTSNPFFVPSTRATPVQATTPASPLAFPGKLRELLIPITIGSVAEPGLACLGGAVTSSAESEARRRDREAREERGEDARAVHGEGEEGAWLCAPPDYAAALESAPAYV
ncbi:hypothetical protein JCM10908_001565 [Rhodotorula pacifica]|uniref:uncharacterized protein n=1 Tax=Rhodotorula pacifica TaxID=1495444 RepID=UPI003179A24B